MKEKKRKEKAILKNFPAFKTLHCHLFLFDLCIWKNDWVWLNLLICHPSWKADMAFGMHCGCWMSYPEANVLEMLIECEVYVKKWKSLNVSLENAVYTLIDSKHTYTQRTLPNLNREYILKLEGNLQYAAAHLLAIALHISMVQQLQCSTENHTSL